MQDLLPPPNGRKCAGFVFAPVDDEMNLVGSKSRGLDQSDSDMFSS